MNKKIINPDHKVIIIGGGVAGLSAGIYAQKCGFSATILESHSRAGGNCTSWKRGGFLFEGGMHWLSGSGKTEALHKLWRYVGAIDDSVQIDTPEPFLEYNYQGTPIRFYRDVNATEKHWLELAPADAKEIKRLCARIRQVKNLAMPVNDIRGLKTTNKTLPPLSLLFSALAAIKVMSDFAKISRNDYISRFSHQGIRDLLFSCTEEKTGVVPLFFTMGILSRGDGGFPAGGSLPFGERMVKQFKALGGELLCGTKAERVIVENNTAVGVMAQNIRINAGAVIITADTMAIDYLFDTPLQAAWLEEMRAVTKPTMAMLISLGINADLKNYPRGLIIKLKQPIVFSAQTYEYLNINNYADDPVYSPAGKTALTILLGGDTYDFWKKAKEENRYSEEKQQLAAAIIAALAAQIPEIAGQVEVCDVTTPLTYERYCGNWKGSWMTDMTPSMKIKSYPSVIEGLNGVYFAGQRIMPPGGLPVALTSGRTAVQHLCRDTGAVFVSET